MRMLSLAKGDPSPDLPAQAIVSHDVRNPDQRSEVLVRKGSWLTADEIAPLLARGVAELHLAVAESDDVGEDQSATRLSAAVAGRGVECGGVGFGQLSFTSGVRGMLRVNAERLEQVNANTGVLLLTAEPDRPVDVGATLGVVKCAPLFLAEQTLQAVEALAATAGPVLEVERFGAMRVGLVAPRERLRGGAFDRARAALSEAVAWYGSKLDSVVGAEASVEGLAAAYRQVLDEGAQLILAAGASGTDSLDIVFEGLRRAGGQVEQLGIPAEPGTACWIGRLESRPVLGLASCELFGQPGALDLILPRLFVGEAHDRTFLRSLALGGLLLGPSRIAPYHTRIGAAD